MGTWGVSGHCLHDIHCDAVITEGERDNVGLAIITSAFALHCICILHLHLPLYRWLVVFCLAYSWWIRWIDGWAVTPVNMPFWGLAPDE